MWLINLTHGLPGAHGLIHHVAEGAAGVPGVGALLAFITPALLDAIAGVIAGALVLHGVSAKSRLWRAVRGEASNSRAA